MQLTKTAQPSTMSSHHHYTESRQAQVQSSNLSITHCYPSEYRHMLRRPVDAAVSVDREALARPWACIADRLLLTLTIQRASRQSIPYTAHIPCDYLRYTAAMAKEHNYAILDLSPSKVYAGLGVYEVMRPPTHVRSLGRLSTQLTQRHRHSLLESA